MLGKLKKIDDLRKIWENEALDFTKWLAQDGNLDLLSDEIGIDIQIIKTEAQVGDFNVDILAEEENTGRKIIIENQLEITNHDHLGKLITYASGHDAEFIIWIVKDVREEHRQAIDWLNEHTDKEINFFAVKIELWQINDSPCAVKFQIISRPNDWAKVIKAPPGDLTDTKMMQLEFWTKFKEYAQNNGTGLKLRKPYPQHWYDISYGNSNSHIALSVNTIKNVLRCEIYIPDSKELFHELLEYKDEIEEKLNEKLEWMELPNKKASRIRTSRDGDITETDKLEEYFEWLKIEAEKFSQVFSEKV